MSGLEIWGALAGIVSVLQATGATGDQLGSGSSSARALDRARTAGNSHHDASQDVFHAIYWNLECFERDVGVKLNEQDRKEFTRLRDSIEKNVRKAERTAGQLRCAIKDHRSNKRDIKALEDELSKDATLLNNLQSSLIISLHIQNFRRASSTGFDAERERFLTGFNPPRRSSDSPSTLFRSRTDSNTSTFVPFSRSTTLEGDHEAEDYKDGPGYISDPQLAKAVQKSDLEQVKALLSTAKDKSEVLFLSLNTTALLLACQHRCLSIVSHCLESQFSPLITDPAGLGVLHNVIGTAVFSSMTASTIDDITTLITLLVSNPAIDPAAPDSTAQALTPLHRATITRNLKAVKHLLKTSNNSSLSSPSFNGKVGPINRSIINIPDAQGKTPLWHACRDPSPDPNLIKVLAKSGGNFGATPPPKIEGRSASHIKNLLENEFKKKSTSRG